MLNPQPVSRPNSPYSNQPAGNIVPPKQSTSPQEPAKQKSWKKIIGLTLLTLITAFGTFAYAEYNSLKDKIIVNHEGQSSAVLTANNTDKLDPSLFSQAGDGRFNLVLVGIGGDNHPGGSLTDSIQVISVDTINKKLTTTSVPRDLYVKIPDYGYAKINEAYQIGEGRKKGGGGVLVRQMVGNVLGINISNFVLLDFAGAKELVNTLGGIEVNVPTAIYDPYFPADNSTNYAPFSINAGLQKMNGDVALKYSRSRETTSDFDRSARQQLVMEAIKKKGLSAGVLSNPAKVLELMNVLGNHVKTDLQTNEIKALASLYTSINSDSSKGFVLDTSDKLGLLTATTDPVAGYISYPIDGYDKYNPIHQWFQKNSPDPLLAREVPSVTVANGGGVSTTELQNFISKLKDYGYTATLSTTSVNKKPTSTQVYATHNQKKPFSQSYLSTLMGTQIQSSSPLNSDSDFEIIYLPTK